MSVLDRRDFLRTIGRTLTAGGLLAGAFSLVRKPAKRTERCISDGICSRCPTLTACGLPQALSAKQDRTGD